jgi:hypothetical protein
MTDPTEPAHDQVEVPEAQADIAPSQAAPAAAAPAAPSFAPPDLSAFDLAGRTVLGGAAVAVIGAIVGVILGAWNAQPFALAIIILGLVGAGAAYSLQAMDLGAQVKPWQSVLLQVTGATATALSALAVIEMVADLDDLDDYGGAPGIILAIIVLAGSAAMLWGGLRTVRPDLRGAEAGARVAALGLVLVLIAWILHLTIGFWAFGPAIWGIAALLLAALLLLLGDPGDRLPAWVGWVAVVLGLFAGWSAIGQWTELMRLGETQLELGIDDILPFLVYVAGILLIIAGGVLHATGGKLPLPGTMGGTSTGGDAA